MKTVYRMAAIATMAIATLISCGNAGAQNDKKQTTATNHVKELDVDTFNKMVYDIIPEKWNISAPSRPL